MKFYQENKVNPFGSCLPLVLQLPVFFSLFYMLRKDLKIDICGPRRRSLAGRSEHGKTLTTIGCDQVDPGQREVPLHPGPDGQGDRRRRSSSCSSSTSARSCLERADVGHGRPQPALHHDRAAVRLRALHHQLPGRPARLLDHDEPLDRRPAVHHPARGRAARARRAGRRPAPAGAAAAVADEGRRGARPTSEGEGRRQGRRRPSGNGDGAAPRAAPSAAASAPPPPPRQRQEEEDRDGGADERRTSSRARSTSCSRRSSTALGPEGRGRGRPTTATS